MKGLIPWRSRHREMAPFPKDSEDFFDRFFNDNLDKNGRMLKLF
jgi:hypothetical protein